MNTMTRQEQIRKAANKYIKDIITPIPASLITAFIKGAAWSDANPDLYSVTRKAVEREREYLIDKACEWLKDNHDEIYLRYIRGYNSDDEIELFKKYMEEQ